MSRVVSYFQAVIYLCVAVSAGLIVVTFVEQHHDQLSVTANSFVDLAKSTLALSSPSNLNRSAPLSFKSKVSGGGEDHYDIHEIPFKKGTVERPTLFDSRYRFPEPYLTVRPEDASENATVVYHWRAPSHSTKPSWREPQPEHSLCLTVHNREKSIMDFLAALFEHVNLKESYEVIIVLDNCHDETEKVLFSLLQPDGLLSLQQVAKSGSNFKRLLIIKTPPSVSLFETRCNNLALKSASGKYLTLIQDDMFMTERDFNSKLAQPLRQFDDLLAVTGRCAHHLYSKISPQDDHHTNDNVGRCTGEDMNKSLEVSDVTKCTLFVRDTVNRGPLTLRSTMLQHLNYLDDEHYTLENDDHDLMTRAYFLHKWKSGLRLIQFDAPTSTGGSRKGGRTKEEIAFLTSRQEKTKDSFLSKILARRDKGGDEKDGEDDDERSLNQHGENRLILNCIP